MKSGILHFDVALYSQREHKLASRVGVEDRGH